MSTIQRSTANAHSMGTRGASAAARAPATELRPDQIPFLEGNITQEQRRNQGLFLLGEALDRIRIWSRYRLNEDGRFFLLRIADASHNIPWALEIEFELRYEGIQRLQDIEREVRELHTLLNTHRRPPPEFLIHDLYDNHGYWFGIPFLKADLNNPGAYEKRRDRRWWRGEVVAGCSIASLAIGFCIARFI